MRTPAAIGARVFLVGCPRSGTTLLQAMLARHSCIYSLPETHFFFRAPTRRLGRLGFASRLARPTLLELLRSVKREDLAPMVPRVSPFLRRYARAFRDILDRLALEEQRTVWVEKTPRHISRLDLIRSLVPGCRFVHILRDGRGVVASLYKVASAHPEAWGVQTIEACVRRWNRDVRITLSNASDPGHIVVAYEPLLENATAELTPVCRFLGLEFEPGMLAYWEAAPRVTGPMASMPWMHGPFEPLRRSDLSGFGSVFSPEKQRQIEEGLLYAGRVDAILRAMTVEPMSSYPRNGKTPV